MVGDVYVWTFDSILLGIDIDVGAALSDLESSDVVWGRPWVFE